MVNALREFEDAHKVWMNTSVFTEAGAVAKAAKDAAMRKYDAATAAYEAERRQEVAA